MSKNYTRYFDLSEKAWLAYEQQGYPQAYIVIIEGTGSISDHDMNAALKKVSQLYPVCHSKLTGFMNSLRWQEANHFPTITPLPPIEYAFGDTPCEVEKGLFHDKMDLKRESPVAVYTLSDKHKQRIYFKVHHTAMDGMGVTFLIHDFFSILRGETPAAGNPEPETKSELFKTSLPKDFFCNRQRKQIAVLKNKEDLTKKKGGSRIINDVYLGDHILYNPATDDSYQWQCLSIPLNQLDTSQLNGKILSAVIEVLKEKDPDLHTKKFQACIPVDLRYLKPGLRNASNLTGPIMVELDHFMDLPYKERISAITCNIRELAGNHAAAMQTSKIMDWFPVRLFSIMAYFFRKHVFYNKKYPYYFFFSNIGRWHLDAISTHSFSAERIFAIPNMQFYCPLFLLVSTHDNGIEMLCATDTAQEALSDFVSLLKEKIKARIK